MGARLVLCGPQCRAALVLARWTALFALIMALGGCASGASNCAGWQAISLSKRDRLTRDTESMILEHNRQGEKQGCWKAPN